MLAHMITTAPRPVPTLDASIHSMRAAGFDETINVLADGACSYTQDNVNIVVPGQRLGGLKAWVYALTWLVQETEAEWLAVLEDDITWAPGAREALIRDLITLEERGDTGYLSLYLCLHNSTRIEYALNTRQLPPGIYEGKLGWSTWGSQALVLPRSTAKDLLKYRHFKEFVEGYAKNRNRDAVVSRYLKQLGYRTLFRVPCLVNHELGAMNSALGDKPFRPQLETKYWTGKP